MVGNLHCAASLGFDWRCLQFDSSRPKDKVTVVGTAPLVWSLIPVRDLCYITD